MVSKGWKNLLVYAKTVVRKLLLEAEKRTIYAMQKELPAVT